MFRMGRRNLRAKLLILETLGNYPTRNVNTWSTDGIHGSIRIYLREIREEASVVYKNAKTTVSDE